jgi:BlaI family penicillinase repressor
MSLVDSTSRPVPVLFTGREMDIMNVLWELGSGTVAEVQDRLADELAYTSVLTILRILEKKGHVVHEQEGRAHRYVPTVAREEAREDAVQTVTRKLFAGSPMLLMTHLLGRKGLTERQLRRLRDLVDQHLGEEEE